MRFIRRNKHEFVKVEYAEIEMHCSTNDARQFFQKIKHMSKGFKTEASFCKDQDLTLVTYINSLLELWLAHLNEILNGDYTNNAANDMIRPKRPNNVHNATPVAPLDREEVAITIQRLNCNKIGGYDGC